MHEAIVPQASPKSRHSTNPYTWLAWMSFSLSLLQDQAAGIARLQKIARNGLARGKDQDAAAPLWA
jgi:hypothetical protein